MGWEDRECPFRKGKDAVLPSNSGSRTAIGFKMEFNQPQATLWLVRGLPFILGRFGVLVRFRLFFSIYLIADVVELKPSPNWARTKPFHNLPWSVLPKESTDLFFKCLNLEVIG